MELNKIFEKQVECLFTKPKNNLRQDMAFKIFHFPENSG